MLWNHRFFLVIVEDLDVVRVPIAESEYDPILVVDANRMKSLEVPAQLFQSVVRWNPKVSERSGPIEQIELALNDLPD